MQKRPKWFIHSHSLRAFLPGSWQIRHRLLSAGVALGLLSVAAPIYMRAHISRLADSYATNSNHWNALDRIHELSALITDTESRLRAYVTSGDREWLSSVGARKSAMNLALSDIRAAVASRPNRVALVEQASDGYHSWLSEIVNPVIAGTRPARQLQQML